MSNTNIEQPGIDRASSIVLLNDMINGNLRTGRAEHDAAIAASGIIENSVKLVAAARAEGIPICWIRVERRADRADVAETLTDRFIASGMAPRTPTTRGSYNAANADELPVLDEDHVILKPRINPFIGTNLDLLLRSMGVTTILLGGYSTNSGVESCARIANDLNYNVVVLSDCSFNIDREAHDWTLQKIMPAFSRVMTSERALSLLS